jgi:hypothetical protein
MEADIGLQNHGIVVHPGDAEPGSEDNTVITGNFLLKSDSSINICGTRFSFIVLYKYKRLGKDTWEEAILHEQSQTYICGDKRDTIHIHKEYEQDKDTIRRRINFSIVVPKDIPTYEYLAAGGIIQPHMRVSVELNNVDWDPQELRSLPQAPPGYTDDGTVVLQNHLLTERWTGGSVIPENGKSCSLSCSISYLTPRCQCFACLRPPLQPVPSPLDPLQRIECRRGRSI